MIIIAANMGMGAMGMGAIIGATFTFVELPYLGWGRKQMCRCEPGTLPHPVEDARTLGLALDLDAT
jgi:hypothetical protein